MGRNDLCFCGSGKKQKKCHCDINENSLVADVIQFYFSLEKDLQADKAKTVCKKGCYECCSDFFSISEVEFAIIMEYLRREIGYNNTMEIIVRCLEFVENFKTEEPDYYMQLEENINGKSPMESLRISVENMPGKQSRPCVFLKNNECSIYEVRPIICRTHGMCYESEKSDEYIICSKMPSFITYKEKMLCIDKYSKIIENVRIYTKNGNGIPMMRRQYPIFYFMKMYFSEELDLNTYFRHPTIYNLLYRTREHLYDYLYNYYNLGKK